MMRRTLLSFVVLALAAGVAVADTKIVKSVHTDGFAIMGQEQPAKDEEHVMWVGKERLIMEQGASAFLVRMDQQKLYLINHEAKTYSPVALPIDLSKLLPPGMADQMLQMMKFTATVTPTDEVATVGKWKARRYDVTMSSSMMQMKLRVWATEEVELDLDAYKAMEAQIAMMQPGMADAIEELKKIKGLQVKSEGAMTIMGSEVKTSEKTLSVTAADAPEGAYDPPSGYAEETFDFKKMQQARQ